MSKPRLLGTADLVDVELNNLERGATFKHGNNILNVEKNTGLNEFKIKGRTLVNLLGRAGNLETLNSVQASSANKALDNTFSTSGSFGQLVTSTSTSAFGLHLDINIDPNKYYILLTDYMLGTATEFDLKISNLDWSTLKTSGQLTGKGKQTAFLNISPTDLVGKTSVKIYSRFIGGAVGRTGYVDSLRLYEITAEESLAINKMNTRQISERYPYVDDMKNVKNPYLVNTAKNLIPPFTQWVSGGNDNNSPYRYTITSEIAFDNHVDVPVVAGKTYTYSAEHNGAIAVNAWDAGDNLLTGESIVGYTLDQQATFTTPEDTVRLTVYFSNIREITDGSYDVITTTVTIANPTLVEGSLVRPFEPQVINHLMLEAELASDQYGNNGDELYIENGEYYKKKNWMHMVLDGSLSWANSGNTYTGRKRVQIDGVPASKTSSSGLGVKYDGSPLQAFNILGWGNAGDQWGVDSSIGRLLITIDSKNSGWGDSYTPTENEIKAYFNGWKMTVSGDATGVTAYNGTGTKVWINIDSWDGSKYYMAGATSVLPTGVSHASYKPYRLQYQLKTPVIEPVAHEGDILLHEGLNNIEVSEGVVVRERVYPKQAGNIVVFNYKFGDISNWLSSKLDKLVHVYRNGTIDSGWRISADGATNGGVLPFIEANKFDPTADHVVTYIAQKADFTTSSMGVDVEYNVSYKSVVDHLGTGINELTAKQSVMELNYENTLIKGEGQRIETGTYTLNNAQPSNYVAIPINFKQAFSETPKVFAQLDKSDTFFGLSVEQITTTSFVAIFNSQYTQVLAKTVINWFAVGE